MTTRPVPASSLVAPTSAIPIWIRIVVSLGALLTAAGAVLALVRPAMLVSPQAQITEAVRIYAGYLVSRNLAIAILLITLLMLRAKRPLSNLMVLVAFIQFLDVCIDLAEGRWTIVPGVLAFGILFLVAASHLIGQPFWKSSVWLRE